MVDKNYFTDDQATFKSVPERLTELGEIYAERAALYGDNYKRIGLILREMMGGSIKLETESDFGRFALFTQIVFKQSRYGQQFKNGHMDSLDDGTVYFQMLQELDDYYGIGRKTTTEEKPNSGNQG